MKKPIHPAALLFLLAAPAAAQCSLATPFTGAAAEQGTMFDIVNTSPITVTITSIDQSFSGAGTADVEVHTHAGTWAGTENNAGAWTLAGSAPGVSHTGPGAPVALPIVLSIVIPPFSTMAVYVTATGATSSTISYGAGSGQLNAVLNSDINFEIRAGVAKAYPFGATTGLPSDGALWNGRVHYTPSYPAYETNSAASSIDFNGVQGTPCSPAAISLPFGSPVILNGSSTSLGLGFAVALSFIPVVPTGGGALETPGGQIVNIDFTDANLQLINPTLGSPFGGPFNLPLVVPATPALSIQMMNVDPGHPEGFSLSQAAELTGF